MTDAPRAALDFAPAKVERKDIDGGGFILRSPMALEPYSDSVCQWLVHWAEKAPERPFLADRDPATDDWRTLSYSVAHDGVRAIAQGFLDRGLSVDRPVMLLSDNSIDNGLVQLGAMYAGIPSVPVSPAYSLMSQDFAKLKYIYDLIRPGLVFADDGAKYGKALGMLDLAGVEVVISRNPPDGIAATSFDDLLATSATDAVDAALARVGPDTIAKILFTSGSTGTPKGVINTQRMLCSNQQAIAQMWRFIEEKPPVTVDWLPWHHTFGGNHNFNMMLRNGGTMYVDGGKPAPGLVEKTIANLRDIAPTVYFNVPRG
ncbi:MAG: AMP-binding protein, partial [Hyphomicrobiales bacterium]|nr:AMP-binding protein [Hyphomicrobiales bacterium]